jgi:hypothetical protein
MRTALVCAGGVGQSFVARMPALLRSVGAVKAGSLRVARRIVNSLHAGCAVDAYSALDAAGVIWIAVPEAALDRIAREIATELAISGRMIVLCATQRDSLWPGPLRNRGARVATLDAIEPDEHTLVAEGHASVLRKLRRVAAADGRKLIEIQPGSKARYLAGVRLAEDLPLPYFAAAVESLRAAGFSRVEAARVVEALGTRSLHAYGKAGRKAWNRATAADLRQSLKHDLDSIRPADPPLAELYRHGIEQALRYFED